MINPNNYLLNKTLISNMKFTKKLGIRRNDAHRKAPPQGKTFPTIGICKLSIKHTKIPSMVVISHQFFV